MNTDDANKRWESELAKRPWRTIPADWKESILSQARDSAAASPEPGLAPNRPSFSWREWFWPHPLAWAGLTALWLAIAGLNLASATNPPSAMAQATTTQSVRSHAITRMALAEQWKLRKEMLGIEPKKGAVASSPTHPRSPSDRPRPRSALPWSHVFV